MNISSPEFDQKRKEWDLYWVEEKKSNRKVYDIIAQFYRVYIIKRALSYFVKKYFFKNTNILHAGCGSGQVDTDINNYVSITALDISVNALSLYKKINGESSKTINGSIFSVPVENSTFDGIYNLGVMEHFDEIEIKQILKEFHRILKKDGIIILFWPPEYGISVIFFKVLTFIYKYIFFIKKIKFHPDEITRIKSKKQASSFLEEANFKIIKYYFGLRDLFTHSVIIGKKC